MSGEQRFLMALEMSLFARELAREHQGGASGMDAFARCSGTRQIGTPASAHASTVAMTSSEVFRRITTALEQAGVAYMLSGSFASAYHVLRGRPRTLTS